MCSVSVPEEIRIIPDLHRGGIPPLVRAAWRHSGQLRGGGKIFNFFKFCFATFTEICSIYKKVVQLTNILIRNEFCCDFTGKAWDHRLCEFLHPALDGDAPPSAQDPEGSLQFLQRGSKDTLGRPHAGCFSRGQKCKSRSLTALKNI